MVEPNGQYGAIEAKNHPRFLIIDEEKIMSHFNVFLELFSIATATHLPKVFLFVVDSLLRDSARAGRLRLYLGVQTPGDARNPPQFEPPAHLPEPVPMEDARLGTLPRPMVGASLWAVVVD